MRQVIQVLSERRGLRGGRRRRHARAGFTLIELMVVVVIIGLLAALVGTNLMTSLEEANVNAARAQIKNFETALMSYKLKLKKFPSSDQGLDALINNERNTNFLDASNVPKDPWGNDYVYKAPGPNGAPYEIISYGANGQPGGSGYDADISSTNLQGTEG